MADYLPGWQSIIDRRGNVVFTSDGNVWVNYQLRGPMVDPYSQPSVRAVRRLHDIFYTSLIGLDTDEIIISGFLAPVSITTRLARAVEGIPEYSERDYPAYAESLREFQAAAEAGYLEERRRVYICSVRVPTIELSVAKRTVARLTGTNPFTGVDLSGVEDFNTQVAEAIPKAMDAIPADAHILEWARQRACLRGVVMPDPAPDEQPAADHVCPPGTAFPDLRINPVPDSDATVTQFARRVVKALGRQAGDSKTTRAVESAAQQSIASYFTSLRKSPVLAISNLSERSAELPDGPVSYQTIAAVGRYATAPDHSINTLTSTVDMAIDLDADFTIRLYRADHLADNERINKTLDTLDREDASNSESPFDTNQYKADASELLAFTTARDAEKSAVPVKITTLFAFGAARLDVLTDRIRAVEKAFTDDGYQLFRPVGGQEELFCAMMPCVASTTAVRHLAGASTAAQLGSYAPIRRISVGDGTGFQFGCCIENTLGTDVHLDMVRPTMRGNGSIAFTGAQGKGKSYAMKRATKAIYQLGGLCIILDGQGEWATWSSRLPSHQIVDLAHPTYSIDPLKLVDTTTDDGLRHACDMLRTLLLPMCNTSSDSEEGAALTRFMTPEYIRGRARLTSTRDLLEHIVNVSGENYQVRRIVPILKQMLADETMGAFIDPVIDGKLRRLPPLQITDRMIVFVTKGLRLPRAGKPEEKMTITERYTLMANTAVALVSAWIFDQYRSVGAFVMDEASFYEDLDVLTDLIKTPDRTGRKFGTIVIVGSQTGSELSAPQYKLVRRRICMGQDSLENAREALAWAGFTDERGHVDPALVADLATDTSPLDPQNNNMPAVGRAGECYFNDGTRKAKIKIFPELNAEMNRAADTSTENFIRYETPAGGRHAAG